MRIRYTTPAKQDLIDIQDYIARHDAAAAHRVAVRIRHRVDQLARHPHLGRTGQIAGTRELSIPRTPYFVVYRIWHGSLEVLAIIHTRRQWPS